LARAPALADHLRIPGSAPPLADGAELIELLERAVALDPRFAPAHAALGNLLLRAGRGYEALLAYRLAAQLAPDFAEAQLAVGELLHTAGDADGARAVFAQGLRARRVFPAPQARSVPRVLLLLSPLGWSANVPLDFVVDHDAFAVHRWFVDDATPELPPYELAFNGIAVSDAADGALRAAERFLTTQARPALNAVAAVRATARPALGATLRGLDAVVVPAAARCAGAQLGATAAALGWPVLVRPVDAHGGRGLARLDDEAALAAYRREDDVPLDVCAFVDFRSPDGWYRKYRVALIDGKPFPYHLAAARDWLVHYRSAETQDDDALRAEEARFLTAPQTVFPDWERTGSALARALGLDLAAVDCARLGDRWLVFEADTAALLYAGDAGASAEKRAAVDAIRRAVTAMLARRARS
jgi:tetratricopeptide (TPR) repeat protein